mmetsp:Transcript_18192/g.46182  ORF Transcript_18192/g.46182 Transcript_18192/m.46182 type:complete len:242 (-) Transcript_18192:487-1212(-)
MCSRAAAMRTCTSSTASHRRAPTLTPATSHSAMSSKSTSCFRSRVNGTWASTALPTTPHSPSPSARAVSVPTSAVVRPTAPVSTRCVAARRPSWEITARTWSTPCSWTVPPCRALWTATPGTTSMWTPPPARTSWSASSSRPHPMEPYPIVICMCAAVSGHRSSSTTTRTSKCIPMRCRSSSKILVRIPGTLVCTVTKPVHSVFRSPLRKLVRIAALLMDSVNRVVVCVIRLGLVTRVCGH